MIVANDNVPKLSICIVSFNQEKYIDRCLSGLLSQDVDFTFEIIIGDDGSTDSTRKCIDVHVAKYPHLIRSLYHEKNIGPFQNYRSVHSLARGEYVAHLDGDDAALPGKLAEQVRFLEENPDCSAVFHQLRIVDSDGVVTGTSWPETAPSKFDMEFLVLNHPVVGHSALMYRRGVISPILTGDFKFIDFRVYVELAHIGSIGYIAKPLGLYTSGAGISRANSWLPQVLEAIECAESYGLPSRIGRSARSQHVFRASLNTFYRGDFAGFRSLVESSAGYGFTSATQRFFYAFRAAPLLIRFVDGMRKWAVSIGALKNMKLRF